MNKCSACRVEVENKYENLYPVEISTGPYSFEQLWLCYPCLMKHYEEMDKDRRGE